MFVPENMVIKSQQHIVLHKQFVPLVEAQVLQGFEHNKELLKYSTSEQH